MHLRWESCFSAHEHEFYALDQQKRSRPAIRIRAQIYRCISILHIVCNRARDGCKENFMTSRIKARSEFFITRKNVCQHYEAEAPQKPMTVSFSRFYVLASRSITTPAA